MYHLHVYTQNLQAVNESALNKKMLAKKQIHNTDNYLVFEFLW